MELWCQWWYVTGGVCVEVVWSCDVSGHSWQVVGEIEEVINTGCWVGDCLIYTNSVNRLNYYVGGEIVTVAHFDRSVSPVSAGRSNLQMFLF